MSKPQNEQLIEHLARPLGLESGNQLTQKYGLSQGTQRNLVTGKAGHGTRFLYTALCLALEIMNAKQRKYLIKKLEVFSQKQNSLREKWKLKKKNLT